MRKKKHRLVVSTAVMGQMAVDQWRDVLGHCDVVAGTEVGLEVVAAFREPLLSLLIRRVKHLGLAGRVETLHGRVDYDFEAFKRRVGHFRGIKKLQIGLYDMVMAYVGESYRATLKFRDAKLLLHAPTLYELEELKGGKPRLRRARLVAENDEKLDLKRTRWGYGLDPVEILRYVKKKGLSKIVFDTAHFLRVFGKEKDRLEIWNKFVKEVGKTPVYWHMNRPDGGFWTVRKSDKWLIRICEFVEVRMKKGIDQVCLEEPAKISFVMGKKRVEEVKRGLEGAIMSLKEYGII